MNSYVFNEEVKKLMKMNIPQDLAILTVSAKLEDKTIFYNQLAKVKEEQDSIEHFMKLKGFELSTHNIENEPPLPTAQHIDENKEN